MISITNRLDEAVTQAIWLIEVVEEIAEKMVDITNFKVRLNRIYFDYYNLVEEWEEVVIVVSLQGEEDYFNSVKVGEDFEFRVAVPLNVNQMKQMLENVSAYNESREER